MHDTSLSGSTVSVSLEDGIAWVELNRPAKRNAMCPQLCDEMRSILEALEVDERCGVVVLTGTGPSFSAGMDLQKVFRDNEHLSPEAWTQFYRRTLSWMGNLLRFHAKPTIAMVNGWCFGGAIHLVTSCDLAVAADEAVFGMPQINAGSVPAGSGLRAMSAFMPSRDVLYYALTGETFTGREAREMRLVNRSVPRDQLRESTRALASTLLRKNRVAARTIKHSFRRSVDMSLDDAEDYFIAKFEQYCATDPQNARSEGLERFLDSKSLRPGLAEHHDADSDTRKT